MYFKIVEGVGLEGESEWIQRGLNMCYGFNHEEAIYCFKKELDTNPDSGVAYWGLAFASGTNYNNPFMSPEQNRYCHDCAVKALERSKNCSPLVRELILAIQTRYEKEFTGARKSLEESYADAMRKVFVQFPDDVNAVVLCAEALMNIYPWKLWVDGKATSPVTGEVQMILEKAVEQFPDHPAPAHLYIHLMELSSEPEKALKACKTLSKLDCDFGHFYHMPSHIYQLLGMYEKSVEVNRRGIIADEIYYEARGGNNFYTLYRLHNYHMLAFSSMFMGRYQPAIDAARKGLLTVDPELLRSIPNYIEAFFTLPYHILIRFGKWKEILAEPFPKEPDVYLCTTATLHYARGIALAATGDTKGARAEQKLLIESYDQIPDMRYLHNCKMRDILAIGKHMLEGEILYREERCKEAFAELRIAVDLEDHLNFDEPWGWMQPVRHALGALLLEQGHAEEAEQVYLADLKRYPDNIWSLKGLTEIYVKTNPDAAKTRLDTIEQLKRLTDHEIEVSCYCRLTREQ